MKTLLFYDIESTGLSKAFDQVLQFAAIRTDEALRELQRYELLCRLTPGVIPSPYASVTHRTALTDCAVHGISEWDAIRQIHAWMNEPGTWSGGYNTLGFDDEFLRFSFYRHVLPPYTHQYAQGCGRFDLYPLMAMYGNYFPEVLEVWPERADGRRSLKLEHLVGANGGMSGQAHHAMTDVEATVALARRLREADPARWSYAFGYFHKAQDQDRVQQVLAKSGSGLQRRGILVSGQWGDGVRFQIPVLYLGAHEVYRNQTLWLRLDVPLADEPMDQWAQRGWIVRKKWGESPLVLPAAERFMAQLTPEARRQVELNDDLLQAEAIAAQAKVWVQQEYPKIEGLADVAALYDQPFWDRGVMAWSQGWHACRDGADRVGWMMRHPCPDAHVASLAWRCVANYAPNEFAESGYDGRVAQDDAHDRDAQGRPRLTLEAAQEQLQVLRSEGGLDAQQTTILDELEQFYQRITAFQQ